MTENKNKFHKFTHRNKAFQSFSILYYDDYQGDQVETIEGRSLRVTYYLFTSMLLIVNITYDVVYNVYKSNFISN